MDNVLEVIDLTQSFTFESTPQQSETDTVVDLNDLNKSIVTVLYQTGPARPRKPKPSTTITQDKDDVIIVEQETNVQKVITSTPRERSPIRESPFGECPICYDTLGKHPLASTKCGHVFCLSCLESSLRNVKKCPTCRRSLYGSTGYHRLYLGKN